MARSPSACHQVRPRIGDGGRRRDKAPSPDSRGALPPGHASTSRPDVARARTVWSPFLLTAPWRRIISGSLCGLRAAILPTDPGATRTALLRVRWTSAFGSVVTSGTTPPRRSWLRRPEDDSATTGGVGGWTLAPPSTPTACCMTKSSHGSPTPETRRACAPPNSAGFGLRAIANDYMYRSGTRPGGAGVVRCARSVLSARR